MHRSFRKAPRTPSPIGGDLDEGAQPMEARRQFDQDRRALPLRHAAPPRQIDLTIRGEGPTLLFIPDRSAPARRGGRFMPNCRLPHGWLP